MRTGWGGADVWLHMATTLPKTQSRMSPVNIVTCTQCSMKLVYINVFFFYSGNSQGEGQGTSWQEKGRFTKATP